MEQPALRSVLERLQSDCAQAARRLAESTPLLTDRTGVLATERCARALDAAAHALIDGQAAQDGGGRRRPLPILGGRDTVASGGTPGRERGPGDDVRTLADCVAISVAPLHAYRAALAQPLPAPLRATLAGHYEAILVGTATLGIAHARVRAEVESAAVAADLR